MHWFLLYLWWYFPLFRVSHNSYSEVLSSTTLNKRRDLAGVGPTSFINLLVYMEIPTFIISTKCRAVLVSESVLSLVASPCPSPPSAIGHAMNSWIDLISLTYYHIVWFPLWKSKPRFAFADGNDTHTQRYERVTWTSVNLIPYGLFWYIYFLCSNRGGFTHG